MQIVFMRDLNIEIHMKPMYYRKSSASALFEFALIFQATQQNQGRS